MRSEINTDYPWFEPAHRMLAKAWQSNRLAHGIVLIAPENAKADIYSQALAKALLCQSPDSRLVACGRCKSCQLFDAEAHPDFFLIQRLTDKGRTKQNISVEQIRDVIEELTLSTQYGGWRICVIENVAYLNASSYNAILKTLEEPGEKTLLVFIADSADRIPATVRSRCQVYNADEQQTLVNYVMNQAEVDEVTAQKVLDYANNSPMNAIELIVSGQYRQYQELTNELTKLAKGQLDSLQGAILATKLSELTTPWQFLATQIRGILRQAMLATQGQYYRNRYLSELYTQCMQQCRADLSGSNLNKRLQLAAFIQFWLMRAKAAIKQ